LKQMDKKKILLILLIVLLLISGFWGCKNVFQNERIATDTGTLVLNFSTYLLNARTVLPEISIASYMISFSNGSATVEPIETGNTAYTIQLKTGTWNITVEGRNTDGDIVASGTAEGIAIVSGTTSTADVELAPLNSGTGTIDIIISWPSIIDIDTIEATLNGIPVAAGNLTLNSTNARYLEDKNAGDYWLVINVFENDLLRASIAEVVYVFSDLQSSKIIQLNSDHFTSAPSAPINLTANEGLSQIELSWEDTSYYETGFIVERSVGNNITYSVLYDELSGNSTVFIDTTVETGNTYYYRIKAANDFGDSGYSNDAAGIVVPPSITGLVSDYAPARSKTWNWNSDDPASIYRSIINMDSGDPADWGGAVWSDVAAVSIGTGSGIYYVHVQARDEAGNISLPATAAGVLDNTPPLISGLSDDTTPTNTKTWLWTSNDAAAEYRHQINQTSAAPTDWTGINWTTDKFASISSADGIYYVHVQAKDQLGNESGIYSVYASLDSTAMAPPAVTGPDVTSDTTPTWSWNIPPDSFGFRYQMDSETGSWTEVASTVTTYTPPTPLSEGEYTLFVQVKDEAENWSGSAYFIINVDTTPPAISGLSNDPETAKVKSWLWTSDDAGAEYRYVVDTFAVDPSSGWSSWGSATAAEIDTLTGIFYLHVQARDAVGNESGIVSVSAELDNNPPNITGITDDFTPDRTKTWNWDSDDSEAEYKFLIDGSVDDPADWGEAIWSNLKSASIDSVTGTFYLHVQARDLIGNTSVVTTGSAILDNTPPDAPVVSAASPTLDQRPEWTWTIPTGSANIRYQLEGEAEGSWIIVGGTALQTYTPIGDLSEGDHTLFVQASDDLANWSGSGVAEVRIDISPPAIEAGSNVGWTNAQESIIGTAADATGLTYLWEKVLGTGTVNFGSVSSLSTTVWGADGEEAEFGLQLTVTDEVGHFSTDTLSLFWDKKGPVPGNSGIIDISNILESSVTLSWSSASDLSTDTALLEYKVVGSDSDNIATVVDAELSGEGRFLVQDWAADVLTVDATGLLAGGLYYFNILVRDSLENVSCYTSNSEYLAGSGGITIELDIPTDETITLDQIDDVTLSPADILTVNVSETFDSYKWSCYGLDLSAQTTNSVSIDCSQIDPGPHRLTVYVTKNGRLYSVGLRFLIQNQTSTAGSLYWARAYGESGDEYCAASCLTSDGGVVIGGSTTSLGGTDCLVYKLDSQGAIEWQKTYGGSGADWINSSIIETSDQGFIIAATTSSFGAGGEDYWILKLNSDGTIGWQKSFGSANNQRSSSIIETSDNKFLVVGYSNINAWIIKLNADGSILWEKEYYGGGGEIFYTIKEITDGDYIVAGYTASFGAGENDYWVLRLNPDGSIQWQKTYGGSLNDPGGVSLLITSDNDILVAGKTYSFGVGDADWWILKLDDNGNILWQKAYGGGGIDHVSYCISDDQGSNFVIAGYTSSFGTGSNDFLIIEIDNNGLINWQKSFGGTGMDNAYSIVMTQDNYYIVNGYTWSYGAGACDSWVLKLNSEGNCPPFGIETSVIIGSTSVTPQNSSATVVDSTSTITITDCIITDVNLIVNQQAP
jgi:hypothetical protein